MSPGPAEPQEAEHRWNLARFFVHNRQVAWAFLAIVLLTGIYGYLQMPKRKDPDIPVRVAVAICPWPGIPAAKVEQLVTRKMEQVIAGNTQLEHIESTTQDSVSVVFVHLQQSAQDPKGEFQDIGQRLSQIHDLPNGAGPINWISDFGDTAALMLTVASPPVDDVEISLRSKALREALTAIRKNPPTENRTTALFCFPTAVDPEPVARGFRQFGVMAQAKGLFTDPREVYAGGCIGVDVLPKVSEQAILLAGQNYIRDNLGAYQLHPDAWGPIMVRDLSRIEGVLKQATGPKYSYRQMDDFTRTLQEAMQTVPQVSKVSRSGVLGERILLNYSQERLAAHDLQPSQLGPLLNARNVSQAGGVLNTENQNVIIDPSSDFRTEWDIGNVLIGSSSGGTPLYLRDLVDVERGYESPPRFLNYLTWKDANGGWQRTRAVTLAMQMRSGEQIAAFGKAVEQTLSEVRRRLPPDLEIRRTSDQPTQVRDNVNLFMLSLLEAIVLVVLVALIGFWDWRSAVLVASSIPLTLAMTFGAIKFLSVDIQQVSIATLIIALGLLVDMPVVAGDAIKRELDEGMPRLEAAWLGPTRLAKAIFFATLTNIVAYLPFLSLSGDTGRFMHSLPVVMTSTLLAALLVSLSFIPLIALPLIRPSKRPPKPIAERRSTGFTGAYHRFGTWALSNRLWVLLVATAFLFMGGFLLTTLRSQFFPKDLSYLSYVDVWLPSDAPLGATDDVAHRVETLVRQQADVFGKQHHQPNVLRTLTTFVGGGGPRFWFSVQPEQQQLNYAQVLIEVTDKHFTGELVGPLQTVLAKVPGARVDVRQLETGKPVGVPVSVRISGTDIPTLRILGGQLADILRKSPIAARVRDDWGPAALVARLRVDPDRANLSGVTNLDVALSSTAAISGVQMTVLRDGDKQIPIVARVRREDRANLGDLENLYVYSLNSTQRVPLGQISTLKTELEVPRIMRRDHFRTVTVSAFPIPGVLPSEVLANIRGNLKTFEKSLPPGYRLEIGGEYEEQQKGFRELAVIMAISVALIYMALVIQFKSAVKPLLVFAAIPFGVVGAVATLAIAGQPFGFMAFLGIASLVGVIVSHVIVLFDFIEEAHHAGAPLEEGLLDAGIVRLRPVAITVGATVLGLVPLAIHGGPLWEPLCFAQIGGLLVATVVTLVLVPVLYTVFVRDLHLIQWKKTKH